MKLSSAVVAVVVWLIVLAAAGKADVTIRYDFTSGSLNDTYGVTNLREFASLGGVPCADTNGVPDNAYQFRIGDQGLRSYASDNTLQISPDSLDSLVVSFSVNSAYGKNSEERILSWGADTTGFSLFFKYDTLVIRGFTATTKISVRNEITGVNARDKWHTVRLVHTSNRLFLYVDGNALLSRVEVGEYSPNTNANTYMSVAVNRSGFNLFRGKLDNIEIRMVHVRGTNVLCPNTHKGTARNNTLQEYKVSLNGRLVRKVDATARIPAMLTVSANR